MQKLARISYNSSNWQNPTGEAKKYESNSHNRQNGFGHEDWLFRSAWQIDGWRYGFIQGVNKPRYNRRRNLFKSSQRTFFTSVGI
jgi:hypothetical protein